MSTNNRKTSIMNRSISINRNKKINSVINKKGFTLVEVIVVLVILAILIAIAVPALTGYIDKANAKATISEARRVQEAIQSVLSEAYGSMQHIDSNTAVPKSTLATKVPRSTGDSIMVQVQTLIGTKFFNPTDAQVSTGYPKGQLPAIQNAVFTDNVIVKFTYTDTRGRQVTYDKNNGGFGEVTTVTIR